MADVKKDPTFDLIDHSTSVDAKSIVNAPHARGWQSCSAGTESSLLLLT